ncbi:MAG: hypothetical protein H6Q33_4479 [Deltaproteobacteria bacterium]|nr:hypothetical protein [Deltaproteobacteria bacterium]
MRHDGYPSGAYRGISPLRTNGLPVGFRAGGIGPPFMGRRLAHTDDVDRVSMLFVPDDHATLPIRRAGRQEPLVGVVNGQ